MAEGENRQPGVDADDDGTPEQYSVVFSKTAGRAEAVVTAWTGSLALLLVVALLPIFGTIQRIASVKAKIDEATAAQARNIERRTERSGSELLALAPEVAGLLDQMISLEIRQARNDAEPRDRAQLGALRQKFSALELSQQQRAEIETVRHRELERRHALLRDASEIRGRRSRESAEQVALRRQITNAPTPIGPIPVRALLVPTLWLALAGGLLTYIAVRRRVHAPRGLARRRSSAAAGRGSLRVCRASAVGLGRLDRSHIRDVPYGPAYRPSRHRLGHFDDRRLLGGCGGVVVRAPHTTCCRRRWRTDAAAGDRCLDRSTPCHIPPVSAVNRVLSRLPRGLSRFESESEKER